MTNEKDKQTTAQILRHYQIECGPVNAVQKDILESSIEKAFATLRAEERKAAWLPIETNPKDETWQIVAKFDDNGKMAWWQRAYWSSRRSLWKTEGGYCTPTHWTPLPATLALEATENRKGEG